MKKNISSIAIVAGGALDPELLPRIREAKYVIGVDRGAYWLLTHGVVPDIAIGDFDSVTQREFQLIQKRVRTIIRHPQQKEATDLELAIELAIGLRPKDVGLFGAIGTRFDHTYASIQVLSRLSSHNIYGYIVDNFNKICIVRRSLTIKLSKQFRYVSIFPLDENATVTLAGFRYNVLRREFTHGSTLGVSNEIVSASAHITVHQGSVLCIESRD